jgi:hypothetical protein
MAAKETRVVDSQLLIHNAVGVLAAAFWPGRQKEKLKPKNSKKLEFGDFQSQEVRTEVKIAQWGGGALYRKEVEDEGFWTTAFLRSLA